MLQAAPGGDGLGARAEVGQGEGEGGDLGGRQRAGGGLHDSSHTPTIESATDNFRKRVRKEGDTDLGDSRARHPAKGAPGGGEAEVSGRAG
ncbi:hypothetical protein GCM10010149_07880 [Nonomuraea roseoviolacea subsp. roseoviolacea]